VDAQISVFTGQIQPPALSGDKVSPGHEKRGKGTQRIDNANALIWF
jgi:hypothetical protein